LLDALKIKEKVFMLGISLGGPTALQFALRHPDRCRGLIMQDAVSMEYHPSLKAKNSFLGKLFLSKYGRNLIGWFQYLCVKFAPASVFDEYLQVETFYDKDKTKQLAEEIMKDPKEVEKLKALINMTSPMSLRMTGLDSEMKYAAKIPRYPLEKLKVPTLVTQSKVDRDVEFKNGEFVANTVPNAEFYIFDGLGHLFWFGSEWPAIYSKMVSFLKKHSKPLTVIKNKFLFETTWVSNMDGAMLTINPNGTFTIDFPSVESTAFTQGTYKIEGNKIIFLNKPGSDICDGIEGTYRINLKDNALEFSLISDKCKSRKKHFKEGWFRL
jgi:alpha-beta hydrolase superfamily lysophospholipase